MHCLITFILLLGASPFNNHPVESASPDDSLQLSIEDLHWSATWNGKTVLLPSTLDLVTKNHGALSEGAILARVERDQVKRQWEPVLGERRPVLDFYNEITLHYARKADVLKRFSITFRVYNEGVALSYTIPEQEGLDKLQIEDELTQFRFDADYPGHAVYSAQGVYERVPLSQLKPNCERPMTLEMDEELYVSIAEAKLVDYARMRLRPSEGVPYALEAHLAGKVRTDKSLTTPWRVLMVADRPGQLIEQNYLIQNLNDPCAIEDTSWIKPGTIIREVTLTNDGAKACVDFAVEQGLDYIHLDAGWYGHEHDKTQDATTVTVDPKRNPDSDLDIHEVIRYADSKGIGVWVYVNHIHLEQQLDELLPLYKEWGIKGIKYGFVNVGTQRWTNWLHEAIKKTAEFELMVDVHDEYRMTGFERTYPNLMTVEGIAGNETMPTPENNLVLPFTRMLCGAGDYTVCWYTPRIKTTHAHQLAASVVYYSPLQFLYWYDQPKAFENEPETAFFRELPTIWDESRVLKGKIGHYIVMARRSGADWYLVGMNAVEQRSLDFTLDFLGEGIRYEAFICYDTHIDGSEPFAVSVEKAMLQRGDKFRAVMANNGGFAVKLTPKQ